MPKTATLVGTAEVAEILHTTVSTINRWAASGRLRVAKQIPGVRGARLFLLKDVVAFRDAQSEDVAS